MGNKCSSPAPVKPARVHNNHGTLPDEKAAAVEFTVTKGFMQRPRLTTLPPQKMQALRNIVQK